MNIAALKQSRFLTKEDFGLNGKLVTIKGDLIESNVAPQDQEEELKHLIFFEEFEKGLVLNSLNAQIIAKIVGSELTENWDGHKIVGYHDPAVVMRGKITGGTRFRAPRNRPAQPGAVPAQPAPRQPARAPAPHNTAQRAPAPAAPEPSDNDGGAGDDVPY